MRPPSSECFPSLVCGVPSITMASHTVTETQQVLQNAPKDVSPRPPMVFVWRNIILFALLHIYSLVGLIRIFQGQVMWQTVLFGYFLSFLGGLGITAGAHRLWTHRAYKARLPLRIFLAICNTLAFQNDIHEWSRDHRVHHKYSDTDADPHNTQRGFFFAHMGWLLVRKHPEVIKKGKTIDCSDLLRDPVVAFQRKYYVPLMITTCFVLPTAVPMYFWGDGFINALFVATFLRYTINLHSTWLVNSAAHFWGNRPYDKSIRPRQNRFVAVLALGEGFHNYHHTFPWDYSTSELGWKINVTTMFIDFMEKIGQAYDLRAVPASVVIQRRERTGEL